MSAQPLPAPELEAGIEAVRDDLEGMLADVLTAVFEEEVEVLPASPAGEAPDAAGEAPDAVALVAVRDDRAGTDLGVHVRVPARLARLLASRMFACDEPVGEDLLDAVGELGNIAGGNVKSLLFPSDSTARLSLPSAVLGGATPPRTRGDEPLPAPVRALVLGEPVELTLVPNVEAGGLIWPPTAGTEVLEGQS